MTNRKTRDIFFVPKKPAKSIDATNKFLMISKKYQDKKLINLLSILTHCIEGDNEYTKSLLQKAFPLNDCVFACKKCFVDFADLIPLYAKFLTQLHLNTKVPNLKVRRSTKLWELINSFTDDLDTLVREGIALSESGIQYVFEGIVPLFQFYFGNVLTFNSEGTLKKDPLRDKKMAVANDTVMNLLLLKRKFTMVRDAEEQVDTLNVCLKALGDAGLTGDSEEASKAMEHIRRTMSVKNYEDYEDDQLPEFPEQAVFIRELNELIALRCVELFTESKENLQEYLKNIINELRVNTEDIKLITFILKIIKQFGLYTCDDRSYILDGLAEYNAAEAILSLLIKVRNKKFKGYILEALSALVDDGQNPTKPKPHPGNKLNILKALDEEGPRRAPFTKAILNTFIEAKKAISFLKEALTTSNIEQTLKSKSFLKKPQLNKPLLQYTFRLLYILSSSVEFKVRNNNSLHEGVPLVSSNFLRSSY
eukprot:TRINITY_DN2376_c0_g1_i3.p1 TRINITY_DN2376_c0_g1~~TRINITY_DN2376_c0_g1_i3.p1  ORF type:complete len:479 (+),score=70.10 TRINITY_DN2376_c0_g1_i3:92-1528(+)